MTSGSITEQASGGPSWVLALPGSSGVYFHRAALESSKQACPLLAEKTLCLSSFPLPLKYTSFIGVEGLLGQ